MKTDTKNTWTIVINIAITVLNALASWLAS